MIEKGMGRTRLTRFAAITVPAVVATGALGFAVIQGAVSADLASAGGFQVGSTHGSAAGLAIDLAQVGGNGVAADDTTTTSTHPQSAEAYLHTLGLDDLCLAANTNSPIGNIGLKINSTSPVSLGDVNMSASDIESDTTTLDNVVAGQAANQTPNLTQGNIDDPGGFAMTAGTTDLQNLNATTYELKLSGLSLSDLSVVPSLGSPATC